MILNRCLRLQGLEVEIEIISFKGRNLGIWGQVSLFGSRYTVLYCNMGHWKPMFQTVYDWTKNDGRRKRWKIREEKEIMVGKVSRVLHQEMSLRTFWTNCLHGIVF